MQQKIGASAGNLKSIEHRVEISADDMEAFLVQVVVDDLATSFVRITQEFLLKRANLESRVQKTLKDAPLMAHITQLIMADDHVAAKIGSVQQDSFGRLFHEAKLTFQLIGPWLAQAFRRLREKHDVVPEHFAGWANRHGLFDDMSLLLEGIRAWERNDQVKAAHVLIPQIERALRKIADGLGVPVTKSHPRVSESVRRDHAGLHSFLSMSLIEARRRNASAFRLRFSQSLARRLHRPSHANVRSTTQRFGRTTNPFA
jgi:hypothetical protein